jgi:hypothetical protein
MILFDWGTYNGLSKLAMAAALGMKLTEIPPHDLARRRDESYFDEYREFARKAFTTVVAHAPYYNVASSSREVAERSWRGLIAAAERAKRAGAEIYNVHLGWRAFMDNRDLEMAEEFLKRLFDRVGEGIVVSVEVPYTRRMLGVWEEVRALRESLGEERVIVSVQLENAWMLETGAGETGQFERVDAGTDENFWWSILSRALELGGGYLSLRFSQVVAFAFGRRVLKKRVPLGMGYPRLEPLARALAMFLVEEVMRKRPGVKAHLIYTGPPETKYRDTITLYAEVMKEAVRHLS